MAMRKKSEDSAVINIPLLKRGRSVFHVIGTTPLLMNRFNEKAMMEIFGPSAPKSRAEKAVTAKHDPIAEYRASMYLNRDLDRPTRVHAPNQWFKGALANAALDIPGAAKAKIERLVQCSPQIDLYGKPFLHIGLVRNSDINHTPDVRIRAIFPEWACKFELNFVSSVIPGQAVTNLLAAAGEIVGCGDWRPQKGGDRGQFKIVDPEDEDYRRICAEQGAAVQAAAYANPETFDNECEDLLARYIDAMRKRDIHLTLPDTPRLAAE